MTQIKKQPRLIQKDANNSQEGTEAGGFPAYSSDLVNIQENARADVAGFFEFFRQHMKLNTAGVGSSVDFDGVEYESGLIVSGMRYKKLSGTSVEIEEGKMYLSGEVVDFPGGTFDYSANPILWIWTGAETVTQRIFKDGQQKNATTISGYNLEQTPSTTPPGGMSTTDNHIKFDFTEIDSTERRARVCENYTISAALYLQQLRENYDGLAWVPAIADAGTSFNAFNINSRLKDRGQTLSVSMFARIGYADVVEGAWTTLANPNQPAFLSATRYATGMLIGEGDDLVACFFRVNNSVIEYFVPTKPATASGFSTFRGDFEIHSDQAETSVSRVGATLWMKHPESL